MQQSSLPSTRPLTQFPTSSALMLLFVWIQVMWLSSILQQSRCAVFSRHEEKNS